MKLTLGLAAALAGCAAAAATPAAAPVYILSSSSDAASSKEEVPSVSPAEARLILLQRLSPAGAGASTAEIPHSSHVDALVSLLNRYGVAPSPLFTSQDAAATALPSPRQLVVMLEGLSDDQIRDAGARLDAQPAFSIADVPSPRANDRLLADDLDAATPSGACPVSQVTNPFDEGCWNGMATVAKYNVQKVIAYPPCWLSW